MKTAIITLPYNISHILSFSVHVSKLVCKSNINKTMTRQSSRLTYVENLPTTDSGESTSFISKQESTMLSIRNENEKVSTSCSHHSFSRGIFCVKNVTLLVAVMVLSCAAAVIIGWILVPRGAKYQLSKMIAISPEDNPQFYSAWISPPFPVYLKVYVFNVTNPEQVGQGEFPKLQELGPFVFLETREKVNVLHNGTDDTVTYSEDISYHFEESLSGNAKLSQTITVVNAPYVAAAIKIADLPWPLSDLAYKVLASYREPLFVQKTVDEILFTGWKVPFSEKIEKDIGITLVPYNTFGYFVGQNATKVGPYTISRGVQVKSSFGGILKFKNESSLNVWGDSASVCNQIDGTDGTMFPPFVTKQSILKVFNAEFCRRVYFTYQKDEFIKGIRGYRFTTPETVLQDFRRNVENSCFCPYLEDNPSRCLKQGALDLGPCRDGAPVAMSPPHFLDSAPEYGRKSGLVPNRSQHETFITVEPLTGMLLQASKKIQINLIMQPAKKFSSLRNIPEMLLPLVWADEQVELDVDTAAELKHILYKIQVFQNLCRWGALGFSLVVCVFITIIGIMKTGSLLS